MGESFYVITLFIITRCPPCFRAVFLFLPVLFPCFVAFLSPFRSVFNFFPPFPVSFDLQFHVLGRTRDAGRTVSRMAVDHSLVDGDDAARDVDGVELMEAIVYTDTGSPSVNGAVFRTGPSATAIRRQPTRRRTVHATDSGRAAAGIIKLTATKAMDTRSIQPTTDVIELVVVDEENT